MVHQVTQCDAPSDAVLTRLERLRDALHDAEVENARLRAEVDGLRGENALLLERLRVADAALEREQMQARGFWSRLGRKLLGDGEKNG